MIGTTSFKRTYANTHCGSQDCCIMCPWSSQCPCKSTPPLETPEHWQESLPQSLEGSLLISPGSWCAQGLVCALQESVFPILWKFCNQMPSGLQSQIPHGFSVLLQDPLQQGNLLCALELSQQCENFFDITVLQFVGCLLSGSMVRLMVISSKRTYAIHHASRSAAAELLSPWQTTHSSPVSLQETLKNTKAALAQSLVGYHESWCAQVFVLALWASLAGMGFDLNAFLPLLQSCWGFSFASGHGESFFGGMEHSPVNDF